MRWLRVIAVMALLAAGGAAEAQFITVSGTATDNIGLPYANGTITPTLNSNGTPTLNGQPYTPPTQPFGLSVTGKFSFSLAANNALQPAGSTWSFAVCSGPGTVSIAWGRQSVCFQVTNLTLNSSQDISAQLITKAQPITYSGSFLAGSSPTCPVVNGLVDFDFTNVDASGQATVQAAALGSQNAAGFAVYVPGSSGNCSGQTQVAAGLVVPCVTDNQTHAGDWVTASSNTRSQCSDYGAFSSSITTYGQVIRGNTGPGTISMVYVSPFLQRGGGGGGGGGLPSTVLGNTILGNPSSATGAPSFFVPGGSLTLSSGQFNLNWPIVAPSGGQLADFPWPTANGVSISNQLSLPIANNLGGPGQLNFGNGVANATYPAITDPTGYYGGAAAFDQGDVVYESYFTAAQGARAGRAGRGRAAVRSLDPRTVPGREQLFTSRHRLPTRRAITNYGTDFGWSTPVGGAGVDSYEELDTNFSYSEIGAFDPATGNTGGEAWITNLGLHAFGWCPLFQPEASFPNGGFLISLWLNNAHTDELCADTTGVWVDHLNGNSLRVIPRVFSDPYVGTCTVSNMGQMAAITDSTTNVQGAIITGGGSNPVAAYCNGTNWVVMSGAGGGPGGGISGTGTAGTLATFTGSTAIGNSLVTDNGTSLTYTGTGGVVAPKFSNPTGTLQFESVTGALPQLPPAGQSALVSGPDGWYFSNNGAPWLIIGSGGGAGAGVTSFLGRTGAVNPATGDYSFSMISGTATLSQVSGAAPLDSPAFTGTPTAATAAPGTNTTQLATTQFVTAAIAAGGGGGGGTITGSGTAGTVPLWSGATALGNSGLTDTGNLLTYTGTSGIQASQFSFPAGALQWVSIQAALPQLPTSTQNAIVSGPNGWYYSNGGGAWTLIGATPAGGNLSKVTGGVTTLPAAAIAANTCTSVYQNTGSTTPSAAGVQQTDVVSWSPESNTSSGWGNGSLQIRPEAQSGAVSWVVCNSSSASITLPASPQLMINWYVAR